MEKKKFRLHMPHVFVILFFLVLVASISSRDYPTVQAIVVILAFWVVLAGTVADLINQRIDPRLRLGGRPV